jgi:hypothetical protein
MTTTSERRVLELALLGLAAERTRIEQEITDLQRRLSGRTDAPHTQARVPPNKGKKMSLAQRRKIAATMKARWAKVKSSKG